MLGAWRDGCSHEHARSGCYVRGFVLGWRDFGILPRRGSWARRRSQAWRDSCSKVGLSLGMRSQCWIWPLRSSISRRDGKSFLRVLPEGPVVSGRANSEKPSSERTSQRPLSRGDLGLSRSQRMSLSWV